MVHLFFYIDFLHIREYIFACSKISNERLMKCLKMKIFPVLLLKNRGGN